MTGTGDLMATALNSRNGSGEHGPFRLNVPSLTQDLVKALPEVGVDTHFSCGDKCSETWHD